MWSGMNGPLIWLSLVLRTPYDPARWSHPCPHRHNSLDDAFISLHKQQQAIFCTHKPTCSSTAPTAQLPCQRTRPYIGVLLEPDGETERGHSWQRKQREQRCGSVETRPFWAICHGALKCWRVDDSQDQRREKR